MNVSASSWKTGPHTWPTGHWNRRPGRAPPQDLLRSSSAGRVPQPGTVSGSDHDRALARSGASDPAPAQRRGERPVVRGKACHLPGKPPYLQPQVLRSARPAGHGGHGQTCLARGRERRKRACLPTTLLSRASPAHTQPRPPARPSRWSPLGSLDGARWCPRRARIVRGDRRGRFLCFNPSGRAEPGRAERRIASNPDPSQTRRRTDRAGTPNGGQAGVRPWWHDVHIEATPRAYEHTRCASKLRLESNEGHPQEGYRYP